MSKAKAKTPRVFVPLTKVDEEQRLVYGTITQEMLDKSGEVMDYTMSKPHFEKWSGDIHTASGGLSKGNLRVMHGLTVAGKLTELEFNDDDKSIEVCSKVVDDSEWEKVLEGCYTGFSVGGKYGKKWTEVIDGQQVKKFEAMPNEVSLVDNPCVPSATFSLVKADGHAEAIAFQVENDDEQWPGFAKAAGAEEEPATEEVKTEPAAEKPAAATAELDDGSAITNNMVVSKATEIAMAKADGTTWADHIGTAREELLKAFPPKKKDDAKKDDADASDGKKGKKKKGSDDEDKTDGGADEAAEGDDAKKADIAVVDRLAQVWKTSDGQTFDKKADAAEHEEALVKAAEANMTDAEKLAARLAKAMTPPTVVSAPDLFEDYDRLGKVVQALEQPFEDGQPKLEKGMYTVSRFANMLWDLGSLTRNIKKEGAVEDGDSSDATVSADMKAAMASLGESLKLYLSDQLTELLAGIDDDVCVETYDYYYRCSQENGDDQLAKDVCAVITDLRDPSREVRDELAKSFGYVAGELEVAEETIPETLQKRFEAMETENASFRKVAEDAVAQVETLAKRVQELADQPMPRAPNDAFIAHKEGDGQFLGKTAGSEEEKMAILQDMLKVHGAEGMATLMIKASQQRGQVLSLRQP